MDKAIYEELKTYNLPIMMKVRIKKAKTEKELAFVLFDYGYAELVGRFYAIQRSQEYFNEWKRDAIKKVDERLNRAVGSAQKFSNATDYKLKIFSRIDSNEKLLIHGKLLRRQQIQKNKNDK